MPFHHPGYLEDRISQGMRLSVLIFGGKGLSQVTGAMADLRRDQDSLGLALSQESSIDLAIY